MSTCRPELYGSSERVCSLSASAQPCGATLLASSGRIELASTAMDSLEKLGAIEAIKQLKARYFRTLDTKDWAGFRDVLADDVRIDTTQDAGGEPSVGADAFIPRLLEAIGSAITVHHGHMAEIEITSPTTACGVWAMEDLIRWPQGFPVAGMHGWGHYRETYVKQDGAWRIASLTLTRLRVDFE
jgi:SnoaL-like domain